MNLETLAYVIAPVAALAMAVVGWGVMRLTRPTSATKRDALQGRYS